MRKVVALRSVVGALVLVLVATAIPATTPAGTRSGAQDGAVKTIDLNRAEIDQLTEIPGIGKTMAGRIIEWRDEHGPFRRVEDLLKVKGIGEKSFQKIRPFVKVGKAG